jgi:hypothetical protein
MYTAHDGGLEAENNEQLNVTQMSQAALLHLGSILWLDVS